MRFLTLLLTVLFLACGASAQTSHAVTVDVPDDATLAEQFGLTRGDDGSLAQASADTGLRLAPSLEGQKVTTSDGRPVAVRSRQARATDHVRRAPTGGARANRQHTAIGALTVTAR